LLSTSTVFPTYCRQFSVVSAATSSPELMSLMMKLASFLSWLEKISDISSRRL